MSGELFDVASQIGRTLHALEDGWVWSGSCQNLERATPLTLELESENDLKIDVVRYPPGETYRLKGTDQDLLTYEGTFKVPVSIRASVSAKTGTSEARGRLRYQACNDRACLAPATLGFDLEAQIDAALQQ